MSGSQLSAAPLVVVSGRSMLPLFYTGDLVVVFKPDPNNVRVGDVIVYRSLFGNLVIHRVIRVVNASPCNPVCFITKGDNNMLDDAMLGLQPRVGVDYGDSFIGKVISVEVKIGVDKVQAPIKIPYLGVFSLLLHGG
ncbi:MAG: signal peptidase I [Thermoproteota archaeon]